MENYQEIIESGRLEQYALGELDPAAQAEVEALARRFPEVRQELDDLLAGLGVVVVIVLLLAARRSRPSPGVS